MASSKAKSVSKQSYIVLRRGKVLGRSIEEVGTEFQAHPLQVQFLIKSGSVALKGSDKAKAALKSVASTTETTASK